MELRLTKKEIQHRLNNLVVEPENFEPRRYGVTIKYFEGETERADKRIDYVAHINLEVINNQSTITLEKNNLTFNQHEPDLINEVFAQKLSQAFYPIQTNYNQRGCGGDEVMNHAKIIERWNAKKTEILDKYQSKTVTAFLNEVDAVFNNKTELSTKMHNDWFWALFFHPKLINYGDKRTVSVPMQLPLVPYKSTYSFKGTQYIEKIPTNYHSFLITFKSDEVQVPNYYNTPKNLTSKIVFMQLEVFFDLDVYHHFPMHTRAYLTFYTKDINEVKTIHKKIQFTMFQQNTSIYNAKKLSTKSAFITGGLVKVAPDKWGLTNFETIENNW